VIVTCGLLSGMHQLLLVIRCALTNYSSHSVNSIPNQSFCNPFQSLTRSLVLWIQSLTEFVCNTFISSTCLLPWWIQSLTEFCLRHISSTCLSEFNPIEFFCNMFQVLTSVNSIQWNWIFLQHVSKCSLWWIQSNWILLQHVSKVLTSVNSIQLNFLQHISSAHLGEFNPIEFFCNMFQVLTWVNSIQWNSFATCLKCSLGWIQSNWIFFCNMFQSAHFDEFNPIEFFCNTIFLQSNWIFLQQEFAF
jgi:hypothetical protein